MSRIELPGHDAVGLRAANPGPLTLEGTNTWIVGQGDVWVIDPGPEITEHVAAVAAEVSARGELVGIALTHSHGDHSDAVGALLERTGKGEVPVVAGSEEFRAATDPGHALSGAVHGQLEVLELPGHAADHIAFVHGQVAYTGDAIFAQSSVFVIPGSGSLAGYLAGLERLAELELELIAPGHGPLIENPTERLREQISHRLEREAKLSAALANGMRGTDEILAIVWDDVPAMLMPAAAVTLAAHLDKLDEDGKLPEGVQRPEVPDWAV